MKHSTRSFGSCKFLVFKWLSENMANGLRCSWKNCLFGKFLVGEVWVGKIENRLKEPFAVGKEKVKLETMALTGKSGYTRRWIWIICLTQNNYLVETNCFHLKTFQLKSFQLRFFTHVTTRMSHRSPRSLKSLSEPEAISADVNTM